MIIPYTQNEYGAWSIARPHMEEIFSMMDSLGLVQTIFIAGTVKTARDWMQMVQNPDNRVFICVDGDTLLAVAWLTDISHNHAFAHHCFFPSSWGKRSVAVAHEFLRYWFGFQLPNGKPVFEVIMGRTPTENERSVKFMEKIGMHVVGVFPKIGKNVYHESGTADLLMAYILREEV